MDNSSEDPMLDFAKSKIAEHPNYRETIIDFYDLAKCEIEDGGSYENEFSHFRSAVEDLFEEE